MYYIFSYPAKILSPNNKTSDSIIMLLIMKICILPYYIIYKMSVDLRLKMFSLSQLICIKKAHIILATIYNFSNEILSVLPIEIYFTIWYNNNRRKDIVVQGF